MLLLLSLYLNHIIHFLIKTFPSCRKKPTVDTDECNHLCIIRILNCKNGASDSDNIFINVVKSIINMSLNTNK